MTLMKKTFSGDLVSYQNQRNVLDQIKKGIGHPLACIGAGIIWSLGGGLRLPEAIRGAEPRTALTILALIGIRYRSSWGDFLLRRLQGGAVPGRRLCQVHR
jgi:hypothetical protein